MFKNKIIVKHLSHRLVSFITSPKASRPSYGYDYSDDEDSRSALDNLLNDVKKGYFVVHTCDQGELNRFVLELGFLDHPDFLKLLELAEEQFGFGTKGVLAVPCSPNVLQKILEKKLN